MSLRSRMPVNRRSKEREMTNRVGIFVGLAVWLLVLQAAAYAEDTEIATGTDHVSTRTGTGPVHGKFDVVINAPGNSSAHVPNLPVISGTFDGTVDLSQAVFFGVPLGSIEGTFTITQGADANGTLWDVPPVTLPFTGRFRLPFALGHPCGRDKAEGRDAAVYLADDLTSKIPIKSSERSVGFPTVRLELSFGP